MPIFYHLNWSLILRTLAITWLITIPIVHLSVEKQNIPLQNEAIQHEVGCAYILQINNKPFAWPITTFVSDDILAAEVSRLILLENGEPVGHPHAKHETIRNTGEGNYSHWRGTLYFSTPDCSDPRTNGKAYAVSTPITISLWAKLSWIIAAYVFIFLLVRQYSNDQKIRPIIRSIHKTFDSLLKPWVFDQHKVPNTLLLVFLLASSAIFLIWVWISRETINGLSFAGAYQVSDSLNYWLCANNLLDVGNFGINEETGEWCQRRSTYPTFLSGIVWFAQRNIFSTLLIQALITSAAIFLVVRRCANSIGILGALVCAGLLFRYAAIELFTLTMTENAGLIFGCVGISMLLIAAERQSLRWMASGIALISIALNARAGAFFVLPFLVLWAGVVAHYFHQSIWRWVTIAFVAVLAGFALQAILVVAVGGSPGNSHGNFSYTLYGLAVGGMGWSQVMIDHPELVNLSDAIRSKAIYALAWESVFSQPELFLHGLQQNITTFIDRGTYGYTRLNQFASIAKACWWIAWVPLFINRRNPFYLLLALSSLGVVFSAPLLLVDGGPRIFAATVAIDALQMSVGFAWVASIITHSFKREILPVLSNTDFRSVSAEGIFAGLLILLLLIPLSPLRRFQTPAPISVIK